MVFTSMVMVVRAEGESPEGLLSHPADGLHSPLKLPTQHTFRSTKDSCPDSQPVALLWGSRTQTWALMLHLLVLRRLKGAWSEEPA